MTTYDTSVREDRSSPVLRIGWIIGKRTDLLFFIGAALGGYAFFLLQIMHRAWHIDMVVVYFLWLSLIDAPHFFDTYSRTYLDRQEMKNRRVLLLSSIAFIALGPLVILLCYGLYKAGFSNHYAPFAALGAFVGMWAYWHVVRQHYGILSLYKRKNDDFAQADRWIDSSLLYVGTLAPFVALLFRHEDARFEIANLFSAVLGRLGWSHAQTMESMATFSRWVLVASVAAVSLVALIYAARQFQLYIARRSVNLTKSIFFMAVIPLHVFVLYHPAVLTAQIFMVAAFVTIFHDFQYHAIVWHYQQNRCHRPGGNPEQYGLAAKVSKSPFVFFGCAVMMGVVGGYIGCKLDVVPGCSPLIQTNTIRMFGQVYAYDFFASIMLGFLMHHYFVDQFIWRPSKDKKLREDLQLKH